MRVYCLISIGFIEAYLYIGCNKFNLLDLVGDELDEVNWLKIEE